MSVGRAVGAEWDDEGESDDQGDSEAGRRPSWGAMTATIGDVERGVITEILKLAIGRAAVALSRLVDGEVALSSAPVEFLSPAQAAARVGEATGRGDSVVVRQHFETGFSGDILLIFPEQRSLELVRAMMRDTVPLDSLTELEQEALLEVGNIVLNACLGGLSRNLGGTIEGSLPVYGRGRGVRILGALPADAHLVMILRVDFAMTGTGTEGYIVMIMDDGSAQAFATALANRAGHAAIG